jgi:hypothetical protein
MTALGQSRRFHDAAICPVYRQLLTSWLTGAKGAMRHFLPWA